MKPYLALVLSFTFLFAGLAVSYYSFQPNTPQLVAEKVANNLKTQLESVEQDAEELMPLLKQGQQIPLLERNYSFYVYSSDSLVYWSDNDFIPPYHQIRESFDIKLLKVSGRDCLIRKWKVAKGKTLIAQIPLFRSYTIYNDYLSPRWNSHIFPRGNITILEPGASLGTPVCVEENCLFRISFLASDLGTHEPLRWLAVVLLTLSIIFLCIFLYYKGQLIARRSPDLGLFLLTMSVALVRWAMIEFNFPEALVKLPLFDPKNFASSNLNPSLGDLLLNELGLIVVGYYIFYNYHRFEIIRKLYSTKPGLYVLMLLSGIAVYFVLLYPTVVVQTVYNNSALAYDISQSLEFDALRVASFAALILSWGCSFLFAHVLIRIVLLSKPRIMAALFFVTGGCVFAVVNEMTGQFYLHALLLSFLYILLVTTLKLYKSLLKLTYASFAYLFMAIVLFAVGGAVTIQHFTRKEKIDTQFKFASNFLIDRDYFGEYLLKDVANKTARDKFIQSRMMTPFLSKDAIRHKIRQVYLPSYFNKYDVIISLFGSAGNPLDNYTSTSLSVLLERYNKEAFKTEYENVYFVNNPSSEIAQRYVILVPVVRSNITFGYIVLELLLKKVIPESVYPELLVDNRFQQFYRTQDFSYAVFSAGDVLYSSGEFNYERFFEWEWLGEPLIHQKGVTHEGYDHIAVEDANNRVAVVSSVNTPFVFEMANFSFLLVLGLSILLLVILIQGTLSYFKGATFFFASRIQLFINLAFILPLIVVSVTTLRLTSLSSQEQLNTEYLAKAKYFGAQVTTMLASHLRQPDEDRVEFENELTDLAKLSNLDANVYTPGGKIIASSQPLIVDNGLLSEYVNPFAHRQITMGENLLIAEEQAGDLHYYGSYAALKSPQTGKLIGILGIPFFQSAISLEKVQITVLANILNVFAGLFIVMILLSYIVSEWLTFPLKFITRTLRRTSLMKNNQPLTWSVNDEIGMMVKEYNQMLYKLGENKAELEQTQRERAWREIAQQVAHEIKNPLTPMKLTLQQLERSLKNNAEINDKVSRAIPSLLSQVDALSDIATSFSSFAKMPTPVIQRVELIKLLKRSVDLHSQSGQINFKHDLKSMYVMGDDQLLGRIFSNIILNAFQATPPGAPERIDISVETVPSGFAKISFRDYGKGIEPELRERVFIPHFSTKKSGSGLGLAIAKQGIEYMGGKIWLESDLGEGTTFFIELPLPGE